MLVSLRWLREHLGFDLGAEEISEMLTRAGIEVEEETDLGARSGLMVVGEVKTVGKHPNADKLTLCEVEIGRDGAASIVCGATNQRPGDKVVVALPGALLPNGVRLGKAKIRGVHSEGMMCSGKELGWNEDAEGILILPPEWKVGEPFDLRLEVSITPNRPDCMSIHGLAREIGAIRRKRITASSVQVQEEAEAIEKTVKVTVREGSLCGRYCARLVTGVKIGPSPLWMVRALESVGLRSINNAVDVTNFVLMELGHPLHAFDAEKIHGRRIEVRHPSPGETMTTIDGTEVTLDPEDLVIADGRRPIALAGVMGGAESEVTESTSSVILEAAHFDPTCVRRMAARHGFSTESSQRFERGMDRAMPPRAIDRAADLIRELCGGSIAKGLIDVHPAAGEATAPIALRMASVRRLLGVELEGTEIADMLAHLGCEIVRAEGEQLSVVPPSWRVDLRREADLIEEIARLRGYDSIPASLPAVIGQPRRRPPMAEVCESLAQTLVAEGFREVINFNFLSEELLRAAGVAEDSLVSIKNPLSRDHGVMRPSLLFGLLTNAAHNLHRSAEDIRLFEMGTVYARDGKDGPREWQEAAALLCGETPGDWASLSGEHDFYSIKGVAERCLQALDIAGWQVEPLRDARFHPHRAGELRQGEQTLARLGELHPDFLDPFDIDRRVWVLEMALTPLAERSGADRRRHRDFSRQPSVARDLALVVPEGVAAGDLAATIAGAGEDLLESVRLFDVYQGEHIEAGKKSLAFALVFRTADRTLREQEAQEAVDRILGVCRERHGAVLRA
jgi:phenylalanyl-tRNA synthetase beta chain